MKDKEIPSSWERVSIRDISLFVGRGQSPSYADTFTGTKAINQKCIRNGKIDTLDAKDHRPMAPIKDNAFLIPGDVCINSTGTGTIGRTGLWHSNKKATYFADSHVTIVRINQSQYVPKFLIEVLQSDPVQNEIEGRCYSGSTNQVELSRSSLTKLIIQKPPLDQQHKIAEILTTIDSLIEQTEAAIAKYQSIKQGMMHDLFTRGVDANGHLRPPREEAPELYKESELGWIPKVWQFVTCGEICKEIVVGIVIQPAKYYTNQGIYVLRSANVREAGIDDSSWVFMSPKDNEILSKSKVYTGDLVTVRTGYPGTTCVIPEWLNGSNCVDIIISRPTNNVLPDYLCSWVNSHFGANQVLKMQGGLAQQHFNIGEMKNLTIALPSLSEQEQIMKRLQSIENKILLEQTMLSKTNKQKQALMQDLLSGRVRVPTDPAAPQEPLHAA